MRRCFILWSLLAGLCLPGALAAQAAPALEVSWPGGMAHLDAAQLSALPRDTMSLAFHGGPPHRFAGPRLLAVLRQAGVPVDSLRGRGLAQYVMAEARDGYRALFSVGELMEELGNARVMVADTMDDTALPAEDGPFRLVVPGDRRPSRSARQLIRIQLGSP